MASSWVQTVYSWSNRSWPVSRASLRCTYLQTLQTNYLRCDSQSKVWQKVKQQSQLLLQEREVRPFHAILPKSVVFVSPHLEGKNWSSFWVTFTSYHFHLYILNQLPHCFYLGPGPGRYGLPSTCGFTSHDPTKRKNPAYSFGQRLDDGSEWLTDFLYISLHLNDFFSA